MKTAEDAKDAEQLRSQILLGDRPLQTGHSIILSIRAITLSFFVHGIAHSVPFPWFETGARVLCVLCGFN